MRVKLAYTVEIEEVPGKIKEILDGAVHALALASSDLYDVSVDDRAEITLSKIDLVRRRLALIDDRLDDCYHALAGYTHATVQEHMPEDEEHMPGHAVPPEELQRIMEEMSRQKETVSSLYEDLGGEAEEENNNE